MSEDFSVALADISEAWRALMPPARVTVAEGIAQSMMLGRPGGSVSLWDPTETPYMVEPVNIVSDRRFKCVCFAGPAQSGKTAALVDGVLCHATLNDPGDALVIQMTQDKAREFSSPRLDRMIRYNEVLAKTLVRDNIHDKLFTNGMAWRIAWPTPSNLSSTSYRYAISTDYDRVADDIGGEGDLFGMLRARIRTFMSRGKAIVESSPGRPITDPNWRPQAAHEAPPVGGVLGIYNRGDRRRWYWPCPDCHEWFEATPGLGLFHLPSEHELMEDIRRLDIDRMATQYARVICPHCGSVVPFDQRGAMQRSGIWLPEGVTIDADGRRSGNPRTSDIASFWLGGVAAAYSTWESLIRSYLHGLLSFALEGKEEALQTTFNTDQGVPYLSRHLAAAAEASAQPKDRAVEYDRYIVPEWTRYVAAFVDVQGGKHARFVVQVHAIGVHQEEQLVDRYVINRSKRQGAGEEFAPIDPASHPEDWDTITDRVVNSTYRTPIDGREIRVYRTMVDSGGEDGVTANAYRWYRRLRDMGLQRRVLLSKGEGKTLRETWHIRETMVGLQAGKQGDVPLLLLNTNRLKDIVDASLKRRVAGPGFYHFPPAKHPKMNPDGWLPESFYDELQAEVRDESGKWTQVKPANEALDGCVGIKATNLQLGVDRRGFWENPPLWAAPLAENSEMVDAEVRRAGRAAADAARVAAVAPVAPVTVERRVRRSSYLSG